MNLFVYACFSVFVCVCVQCRAYHVCVCVIIFVYEVRKFSLHACAYAIVCANFDVLAFLVWVCFSLCISVFFFMHLVSYILSSEKEEMVNISHKLVDDVSLYYIELSSLHRLHEWT